MKNRIRKTAAMLFSCIVMMSSFTACSSGNKSAVGEFVNGGMANGSDYDTSAGAKAPEEAGDYERKVIRTVSVTLETREFDKVLQNVDKLCDEYGGYTESSSVSGDRYYNGNRLSRYAQLTLRIPQDKVDEFCENVAEGTNVVDRSENTEDVTLNYIDTDSRRKSLEAQQERLLELMGEAENLDEIIKLEERLSQVRYELESAKAQLNHMDNRVDYSTVNLYIDEAESYTVSANTFAERVKVGFMDTIDNIGDGAVDFAVWFVVNLPYFVIVGIPAAVIIAVVVKKRGKLKAKVKTAPEKRDPKEKNDKQ